MSIHPEVTSCSDRIECLLSMTLLPFHPEGKSCSDLDLA